MRRLLLATVGALALSACGTPVTARAVTDDFAETFGGLFVQQQQLLGRTDVSRAALHPLASCRRTGAAVDGPGDDWACSVQYVDLGRPAGQVFEVRVRPDGCWTADAPAQVQPVRLADPLTGQYRSNPLAGFDGCVDTAW